MSQAPTRPGSGRAQFCSGSLSVTDSIYIVPDDLGEIPKE